MGRFAKRFSGERPISLGFELTFLSEFKRVVWRVLDRAAKRRACISVKHPPKCHKVGDLQNRLSKLLIFKDKYAILSMPN